MSGTASGRVTSATGGIDGTTVGATGGGQTYTMQRFRNVTQTVMKMMPPTIIVPDLTRII